MLLELAQKENVAYKVLPRWIAKSDIEHEMKFISLFSFGKNPHKVSDQ